MWRNYLAAALRNLSRNRLHTAITTLSLAIGFTAVILASLFWRHEHSYDRFWPNADRLTLVTEWLYSKEGYVTASDAADPALAVRLADLPPVQAVARTALQPMVLAHGQVSAVERDLQWADPNLLSVLIPRLVAGDLHDALARPNSIVLTRELARKYFGDVDPIGQVMTIAPPDVSRSDTRGEPLAVQVTAVIEQIPVNSHLRASAFVSGMTGGSPLIAAADGATAFDRMYAAGSFTYVLTPKAADRAALQAGLDGIARQDHAAALAGADRIELRALPIDQAYAKPAGYFGALGNKVARMGEMKQYDPGQPLRAAIAAGLMMVVASINFVILMTARGAGRAVEVGIRKAAGARRIDLAAQFVGECLIYAGLAFVLGLAGAELAIPAVNAFTGLDLGFDYRRDIGMVCLLVAAALAMGAIAGAYPALALSAFRPTVALKGGPVKLPGSSHLRHGLIAIQFIPLILLGLSTLVMHQTMRSQDKAALSLLDPDALLIEETCTPSLKTQIAALPGVTQIACLPKIMWFDQGGAPRLEVGAMSPDAVEDRGGQFVNGSRLNVDYGALEFHGMRPLAGRSFSADRPEDDAGMVVNEAGRARLGFASTASAVGASVIRMAWPSKALRPVTIIGVVNNRDKKGADAQPEFFFHDPAKSSAVIGVKLAPAARAASLAAIDQVWMASGKATPMKRSRYADRVAALSAAGQRLVRALGLGLGLGLFIAAIGLFGLSAFLAEQRTKEIGVRKALGAGRTQVLRRLLVQFSWPVILANMIACPLFLVGTGLLFRRLPVAQRPVIGPDIYLAVIAGSMLVAFIAVFANAWRVSGQRPVTALRYE
ncbi:MAG: hypothetical protein JWM33_2551 [Caulobacteraceae bacterium]|nr:hypothetical protein [Caulobacteraceae bacterium]